MQFGNNVVHHFAQHRKKNRQIKKFKIQKETKNHSWRMDQIKKRKRKEVWIDAFFCQILEPRNIFCWYPIMQLKSLCFVVQRNYWKCMFCSLYFEFRTYYYCLYALQHLIAFNFVGWFLIYYLKNLIFDGILIN